MEPFKFESLTILVPELWDKEWDQLIDDADGYEREFLAAQARYARMLQGLKASPATPEKIAWLALWSRLFGCLTGGRGAAEWESRFASSIIARVCYETTLHIQAVLLPVLKAVEPPDGAISEEHWEMVRDRLRGYLAWTLRGDQRLYRHVLQEQNLNDAFDPRPEREFIRDLGESREAWERLSRQELEIVSDQEAFNDRAKAVAFFRSELNRVTLWLADSRLQPWRVKLSGLESATDGSVSLFALLDAGHSVSSFLRSRNAGVGYYEYLKGSAFVHGSSLETAMFTQATVVAPDFADLAGGFRSSTEQILSQAHLHAVLWELCLSKIDG
jgi:hypothetical protein